MASDHSARRVGYATLAALFFASQAVQPALAQSGSAGATIVRNSTTQAYQYKGGALGIRYKESETYYKKNGEPFTCMIIEETDPYGPASAAGVIAADTLCSINGYYFENTLAMSQYIGAGEPGAIVSLRYSRPSNGQLYTGNATISAISQISVPFLTLSEQQTSGFSDKGGALGIVFESVGLELSSGIDGGIKHPVHAAKILKIQQHSRLNRNEITEGDSVYLVGNNFVSSQESYLKLVRSYEPGQIVPVEFLRERDGRTYRTAVQIVSSQPEALVSNNASPPPTSYSSTSSDNSSSMGKAVVGVLGLLVAGYVAKKIFSGSSSTERSRDNSYGYGSGDSSTTGPRYYDSDTSGSRNNSSTSSSPTYSGGLYGNCHGGSFYGCP